MGEINNWISSGSFFGVRTAKLAVYGVFGAVVGLFVHWLMVPFPWWFFLVYLGVVGVLMLNNFEPPLEWIFYQAKQAGYDGVQLVLTNRIIGALEVDPEYIEKMAWKDYGLMISYHQPWDIKDFFCQFLINLGIAPEIAKVPAAIFLALGCSKRGKIGQVVIHSNQMAAITDELKSGAMVEMVDDSDFNFTDGGLVFDVGYALMPNYRADWEKGFVGLTVDQVKERWTAWWNKWGRWCRQIHFYDILPGAKLKTKNRLPGTGMLPLSDLKSIMMASGQLTPGRLDIVLELNPLQIWWNSATKLRQAIKLSNQYFR
jgi:hypothetical protein